METTSNAEENKKTTFGDRIFFISFLGVFAIINIILLATGVISWSWQGFGIILAAGLTLSLYSFLYKDNPMYKFAEHLYVGVAAGYLFIILWYNVFWPKIFSPLFWPDVGSVPNFTLIVPLILGLLMITRFIPKVGWLSRYPFAFFIGWFSGETIVNFTTANILKQAYETVHPLIGFQGIHTPLDGSSEEIWLFIRSFDQIFIFIGLLCVFIYFFFSVEHKKGIYVAAQIGVGFLMIAFGASFGFTIMARLSLLIGRVRFLLFEWLQINEWTAMAGYKINETLSAVSPVLAC